MYPIHYQDGKINKIVLVMEDITKFKLAEEELRKHQDRLEDLIKERTAELVKEITERKQTEEALRENENRLRLSMRASKAGSWIWDIETNEVIWDDRMQEIFGYVPGTFDGTYEGWKNRVHPEDREEADRQTVEALNNRTDYDFEYKLNLKSDKEDWRTVRAQATVVSSNKGEQIRMAGFCEDITERKKAEEQVKANLKEKEILLQEIHHRVKNNMQVINSLLKLQANNIQDEQIKEILNDSQSRVYAMSAIHEMLHSSEKLSEIDLKTYLSKITTSVFQTYSADHRKIKLNSNITESPISINQAYPLGLAINELISNAMKYAFLDERTGEISVSMQRHDKELELIVIDNGIGMPKDFDWKNIKTLGLKLVRTLVENQLKGTIKIANENGIKFTIKFTTASICG
jgi:PAS domain S-box-containing protein